MTGHYKYSDEEYMKVLSVELYVEDHDNEDHHNDDEVKLGRVNLNSADFLDISRDNQLYYDVYVAPEGCKRGKQECPVSSFSETVFIREWGTEQIMTITDDNGVTSILYAYISEYEGTLSIDLHTNPYTEFKIISCQPSEYCQISEEISVWRISGYLDMKNSFLSVDVTVDLTDTKGNWYDYNLANEIDLKNSHWNHTLTTDSDAGNNDVIYFKEFNFADPNDSKPINLDYHIENHAKDGTYYRLDEYLYLIPGFVQGSVYVETKSIPDGYDFSWFQASQNGGYNMLKINNDSGNVTLACE